MPKTEGSEKHIYVPEDLGSIYDLLGWMMLYAPECKSGMSWAYEQNIDITFFRLNEGLKAVRRQIGEETYLRLVAMSQQMRAHFDADPEDKTGECQKGRILIDEMTDILRASRRRKAPRGAG